MLIHRNMPHHAPYTLSMTHMTILAAYFVCGGITIPLGTMDTIQFLEHIMRQRSMDGWVRSGQRVHREDFMQHVRDNGPCTSRTSVFEWFITLIPDEVWNTMPSPRSGPPPDPEHGLQPAAIVSENSMNFLHDIRMGFSRMIFFNSQRWPPHFDVDPFQEQVLSRASCTIWISWAMRLS